MKPENFIRAVLVMIAIAAGVWWFSPTAPAPSSAPAASADATTPGDKAAAEPVSPPAPAVTSISSPPTPAPSPALNPPPARASVQVVNPSAAPPTPAVAPASTGQAREAPADLKAALADIARILQTGDMLTFAKTYLAPDKFAQLQPLDLDTMRQVSTSGDGAQMLKPMVQVYESLADQMPTFNETGDKATYVVPPPPGTQAGGRAINFDKINGRWYLESL